MACKSDLEYNFAAASSKDELVYGAARPGAKSQRCFNPEDKVTASEVVEWADFMKKHGVKRVVGLLSSSELETYAEAAPSATLSANGLLAINISVEEGDQVAGTQAVLKALQDAVASNEKVVLHCWGGGGRTGRLLAAFLMKQYSMTAAEAANEVMAHAKNVGASRRVDVAALEAVLPK